MLVTATRAGDVIDALLTAFQAVPGVKVYDGQPFKLDVPDVIVVGFSPSRPAVDVNQRTSDWDDGRAETMTVVCLASALRGKPDIAPVRARAMEILDAVQAALAADPTLGGLVERAEIGMDLSVEQAQTDKGAAVTVEFSVAAQVL